MSSNVRQSPAATTDISDLKNRLRATWMTGDYDVFSRYLEKDAGRFFRRLKIAPGTRFLDVGCGAGQLALIAARAGAEVTGSDIAANWIEKARERAAAEGLDITFEEGDAESLPYADASFDVVASLIAAMFAPRPERVAAELTRVCRPGGTIAMANWTPGGFVGKMFKAIAKHIAPSGMPAPVLWGDEDTVRERLKDGIAELRLTKQIYHMDYPFPPSQVVEFFRLNYGPMTRAFASLDAAGQQVLRDELTALWTEHNKANVDGRTSIEAEYLEVIAVRSGKAESNAERRVSQRAEALASRIEQGAKNLADFVEGLSEAEWKTPMSGRGTDKRTVGVIVHHVALVYPLEVELAQAVARGEAVREVTWDAVAKMNAGHAVEQAAVTKAAALELLRRNSQAAASDVRKFTDEELDRAAPVALNALAPVTAQFVIEDHALRHSWHHLARIREVLGR